MGKLKNILRWCRISNPGQDDKQFPAQQIEFLGKTADALIISPYGMHSNIPTDVLGLVVTVQGHQENKAIIGVSAPNRPKLESGEISFYSPESGSSITLKTNGDIEVNAGSGVVNMTADSVNLSGDLNVDGDTSVKGITSNGTDIGDTHTHIGSPTAATGAQSPTGAPN